MHVRRVGERVEVDEPDAVRARADLTRGRFQGQAGLAGTARAGQRDEPVIAQQPCDLAELALAADEAGQRRREVVPLHGRGGGRELLAQDGPLERPQRLARVESETLGEERPRSTVGRDRFGLTLRVVERQHQLAPQAFAQRLLGDETLQLGDERRVTAERQLRVDPILQGEEPQLVQPARLVRHHTSLSRTSRTRAAPQRERRPESISRAPGGAARQGVAPSR